MTGIDLFNKYAHLAYQNSHSKGFWEEGETRSKGKMVMLVLSELSEAMEGDGKDHRMSAEQKSVDYSKWCFENHRHHTELDVAGRYPVQDPATMSDKELFNLWFETNVKNTIQDEMADVAIRIMDFVFGWRCMFYEREYRKESTGVFAEDLLRLAWYIMLAHEQKEELHPGKDWGYAWAALIKFCEWWDIDLDWHIIHKMRYNAGRPHKHGKNY